MSGHYVNNLTGDFSLCFSEHLTGHPTYFMALPLPWLKFFPSSTLVFAGAYLLTPIIKISLCLLLYIILDKVSPKINGLLSGNRSK